MAFDKNGKQLPKGITWVKNKNLYMARFTYQGISYTMYDKDLKNIKKKLSDKRYEVEHGLSGKADKVTLNQWFEIWIQEFKQGKVKNSTINAYETNYNNHVREVLGNRYLSQIKPVHIQKLYNNLLAEKQLAGLTIKKIHTQLKGVMESAVKNDLILKNPCIGTELPALEQKEMRVLSMEEQEYLLNFIRQEEWKMYEPSITVMLGTGMRIGELLGLTWEDIDFNAKTISVNKTLVYLQNRETKKYEFELQNPKTKYSKRIIPMFSNVEQALKRQKYNQNLLKIRGSFHPKEGFESLVFTSTIGTPQQHISVQKVLNRIVEKINEEKMKKVSENGNSPFFMEHINLHALRHSFATRCFEADIPAKTVQMLLGHSAIKITLDLYTHVSESKKIKDIQKLEHVFSLNGKLMELTEKKTV